MDDLDSFGLSNKKMICSTCCYFMKEKEVLALYALCVEKKGIKKYNEFCSKWTLSSDSNISGKPRKEEIMDGSYNREEIFNSIRQISEYIMAHGVTKDDFKIETKSENIVFLEFSRSKSVPIFRFDWKNDVCQISLLQHGTARSNLKSAIPFAAIRSGDDMASFVALYDRLIAIRRGKRSASPYAISPNLRWECE